MILYAVFSMSTFHILAMEAEKEDVEEIIEVIIDKQDATTPLMHGDRVLLKKIITREPKTPHLPPLSLGCKIFSGIFTTGFCIGTTLVAGIGEWSAIKYLDENTTVHDGQASILVGTTVGMGICTLGLLTYTCGVGAVKCYRSYLWNKSRPHFSLQEECDSVV